MEKKITKEQEKELLILRSNYQMHLKTREEVALRGNQDGIERIDIMLRQILDQMASIDPKFAQDCYENSIKKNTTNNTLLFSDSQDDVFTQINSMDKPNNTEITNENDDKSIFDGIDVDEVDVMQLAESVDDNEPVETIETTPKIQQNEVAPNNGDDDAMALYDIIPLPSKGECYRHKKSAVKVAFLTAADENIITSPNLYESGEIINILLKRKIMDKDINVDELVSGDVDAVMVFLRGTAYGNEFPIETTVPGTNKTIKTSVDLSTLNYKPFTLNGDENGHFSFKLPRTKAEIKFKFLTKKEEKLLQKLNKKENNGIASIELKEAIEKVKRVLKSDTKLSSADKNNIINANEKLEKWAESLNGGNTSVGYTKSVTNTMEMQIVSINGNTDRKYIHDFVNAMPASDSLEFRRYVYDNSPGVDFEVEVAKPESMGGGSFTCFLEWDDYVFWTV